jgi:hypothetical protein
MTEYLQVWRAKVADAEVEHNARNNRMRART